MRRTCPAFSWALQCTAKGLEDAASDSGHPQRLGPGRQLDHFALTGLPANGTLYLDAAHTQSVQPGMPSPVGPGGTTTLYFVPAPTGTARPISYTATDNTGLDLVPGEGEHRGHRGG